MLSHAGSQYPISSYNESRNSPLRPLDKSMSYHELSEKRSAFLEKVTFHEDIIKANLYVD